MFSAPQRQLKVAFKHGSSKARRTKPSFGCRLSLSGQGPPHRREQDHSGSRQLRQRSSLPLLLRCYSQTALTDLPLPALSRCRSASPQEPARFWKPPRAVGHRWRDARGPGAGEGTSGQASPGALRCAEAGVPFALVLKSRRHVERCPGPRVRASARQRPASPLRPSFPLLGAASCHPGHLPRRLDTMAPGPTRARLHARWQHRLSLGPGRRVRVWRRRGKRLVPRKMRD